MTNLVYETEENLTYLLVTSITILLNRVRVLLKCDGTR